MTYKRTGIVVDISDSRRAIESLALSSVFPLGEIMEAVVLRFESVFNDILETPADRFQELMDVRYGRNASLEGLAPSAKQFLYAHLLTTNQDKRAALYACADLHVKHIYNMTYDALEQGMRHAIALLGGRYNAHHGIHINLSSVDDYFLFLIVTADVPDEQLL